MTQLQPIPSSSASLEQQFIASSIDTSASSPILAVKQLTFGYPNHPPILQDLSFSLSAGEKVAVIGPNGAGKTSLFMTLCGILAPTAGEIALFDQPVTMGEFRPELGFVFQNPDDQLFSATVEADVAFGPENMGCSPQEVAARTEAALSLTGMLDHKHCPPHHLSGGEKRMVAIATVLSMLPQLIIYDEPSANLDLRARRRLIQFLRHSQETILVSSHDLEFLLEVCDRVLLLDEGRIIADGSPKTVMADESLMVAHGMEKPHSLIPHEVQHG